MKHIMNVITSDRNFSNNFLEKKLAWEKIQATDFPPVILSLCKQIFNKSDIYSTKLSDNQSWDYLFIEEKAERSQFDVLVDFSRKEKNIEGKIACLAGSGKDFHGFRGRKWESLNGNIHLSVLLNPGTEIEHFHAGMLVVSALSVINVIDTFSELKNLSKVKWVNDIVIEKKKIAGVISQAQTQGREVTSVVIGLGVNIFTTPCINTDSVITRACSLSDYITQEKISLNLVFNLLSDQLNLQYENLKNSRYKELLDFYTKRSLIVGEKVKVISDPIDGNTEDIFEGIVERIGDNLELFFRERKTPVTKGRLIL